MQSGVQGTVAITEQAIGTALKELNICLMEEVD